MAVQEQVPYVEYVGNGVTKAFPVTFDCEDQKHLIVMIDGVVPLEGQWQLLDERVEFITPPKSGALIAIKRDTPLERTTTYKTYNNSFRPEPVNNDFDRIWRKLQELGLADWLLSKRLNKEIKDRIAADIYYYALTKNETDQKLNDLKDYIDALVNNITGEAFLPILDRFVITGKGRTQEQLNISLEKIEGGLISSESYGLVPNSDLDQSEKLIDFLKNDGFLILKPGTYKAKNSVSTMYLKSDTTLMGYGATIDFSGAINQNTGRIRSENLVILSEIKLVTDTVLSADSIEIESTSSFKIGDVIKISSSDRFSSDTLKGEYLKICRIEGNILYFYEALHDTYLANTTTIIKYDLAKNISIFGLTIKGRGSVDSSAGFNERALLLRGIENLNIRDVQIFDFDRMGVVIGDTYGATVDNCTICLAKRKNDNYEYIQYGISICDANRNTHLINNNILGCKHGIAFTSYSGLGIAINSFISSNSLSGSWASAIATHMTNTLVTINNNHINNCGGGIDIRINSVNIHDNHVTNIKDSLVSLRGLAADVNIYNNKFGGSRWGVRTFPSELIQGSLNRIKIKNNKFNSIEKRAIVIDAGVIQSCQLHSYSNNEFSNVVGDGIYLIGDIISPEITGNTHKNTSVSPLGFGVYLAGVNGARISNNLYEGMISVRLALNGLQPTTNTKIVDNSYTRIGGLLSAATGTSIGLVRIGNKLLSSNVVGVTDGLAQYPNGAEFLLITPSSDASVNNLSYGTIGDIVTICKGGSYTLKLQNKVGNLNLLSDYIFTNSNQTITLVFNGSVWCEVSRSSNM